MSGYKQNFTISPFEVLKMMDHLRKTRDSALRELIDNLEEINADCYGLTVIAGVGKKAEKAKDKNNSEK